ncbi:hypothetical protein [Methanoculleus chikugoensis]|uniref:hypothetical protein n=1 Tax=Methanoculleus chikugoensis TaxID=118126 RepID=UPI001FB3E0BA|nr:hypothetical protein [Methanoculleus chikugoensis]
MTIEGHAAVNPAGRAVVIRTRAGGLDRPVRLLSAGGVRGGGCIRPPALPLVRGGCPMRGEVRRAIEVLAGGGYMM